MQIYQGTLTLLDYVFYATTERGKVYETGAFIHNYALTYALGLAQGNTYTYAWRIQKPHYHEELTSLNDYLYITPAAPQQISHRLVQWNTIREGYAFPGKARSIGYPDWGFARVLRPGSCFTFYTLISDSHILPDVPALHDLVGGNAVRIRLGKFLGKACLHLRRAQEVQEHSGPFRVDIYLNWRDLEVNPLACDVIAGSLPTRLLTRAHFERGLYYKACFGDDVILLPVRMRFLARPSQ